MLGPKENVIARRGLPPSNTNPWKISNFQTTIDMIRIGHVTLSCNDPLLVTQTLISPEEWIKQPYRTFKNLKNWNIWQWQVMVKLMRLVTSILPDGSKMFAVKIMCPLCAFLTKSRLLWMSYIFSCSPSGRFILQTELSGISYIYIYILEDSLINWRLDLAFYY